MANHSHPIGLIYIAIVAAFFNYALGTINSLMVLYLTNKLHLAEPPSYAIFAAFNALIFTLPIIGGYMAARFSYKLAIVIGTIFCIVALVITSIYGLATFYIGLGLYAVGYGLALPSLFSLPSMVYDKDDPRRASGVTLFYIIMNIGFLISGFASGYISQYISYHAAFMIAAISLLISVLTLLTLQNKIHVHENIVKPNSRYSMMQITIFFCIILLIGLPFACMFIRYNGYANIIMWAAAISSILIILALAIKQTDALAKMRLYAFLTLIIIGLFFWIIYMLEPSLVTLFIEQNVNRHVFGTIIPAASFYSLDPVFVIIIGVFFSYLWRSLAKRGKLPSIPAKFSMAIIIMGLGSIVLYTGIQCAHHTGLTHSIWVVIAYIFFAVAELLIAPIGIAMVGRLAPDGYVGLLMGMFNLFVGFAAIIAGYIGKVTSVPEHASLAVTNGIYSHTFLLIGSVTVALGILSAGLIPIVKNLIQGKRGAVAMH